MFSQNGMIQAEKEGKKFQSQIPFILDPGKKIPKKIAKNSVHTRPGKENSEKLAKNFKKLKKHFPALFLAKTG